MKIMRAPKRPRMLRWFESVAHKDHGDCAQCNHRIQAGEGYFAHVLVFKKKLWVVKFHDYCPSDWFEEQEEFDRSIDKLLTDREKWSKLVERKPAA